MRTSLVIETYFSRREQNFYYLQLPDVGEAGFYRAVSSFNAFFSSVRSPRANVTAVRQFTSDDEDGLAIRRQSRLYAHVEWETLRVFSSIWAFYAFIGYDHKARRYASGERMKRWGGTRFV